MEKKSDPIHATANKWCWDNYQLSVCTKVKLIPTLNHTQKSTASAIFAFFTFCLKDTKNSHKEKTDSFSYIKELRKKKVASPKFREDTYDTYK